MSFEVLDSVFRDSRFRSSVNHAEKEKIAKFFSDPVHRRFTLSKFQRTTGVVEQAEALLSALIQRCEECQQTGDVCYDACIVRKTTEIRCPSTDHETITLERVNDDEGWCYLCEHKYRLDEKLDSEVVYTRLKEPDKPLSESTDATVEADTEVPLWRKVVKWIFLTIAGAIIGYLVIDKAIPLVEILFTNGTSGTPALTLEVEPSSTTIIGATEIASPRSSVESTHSSEWTPTTETPHVSSSTAGATLDP